MNEIELLKRENEFGKWVNKVISKIKELISHDKLEDFAEKDCDKVVMHKISIILDEKEKILEEREKIFHDYEELKYSDGYLQHFSRLSQLEGESKANFLRSLDKRIQQDDKFRELYNDFIKMDALLSENKKRLDESDKKWWCLNAVHNVISNLRLKEFLPEYQPKYQPKYLIKSDCEEKFFALVKHAIEVNKNYTERSESLAIEDLFKAGFSHKEIADTLEKYSPISAYDKDLVEKNIRLFEKNMKNTRGR